MLLLLFQASWNEKNRRNIADHGKQKTRIALDDENWSLRRNLFAVNGKNLPLLIMEVKPVVKWCFGDISIPTIEKPGGLLPGEHRLELYQRVKTPYIPNGVSATDIKVLTLPA